jgi:hypothetical protein
VLLYDLTSTYFEADPGFPEGDKRRHGYSRDHRPDCVQVVIALVVTPEGLPLAYEVLPGNTADNTTFGSGSLGKTAPRNWRTSASSTQRQDSETLALPPRQSAGAAWLRSDAVNKICR